MRDKIMRPIVLFSSIIILLIGGIIPSIKTVYAIYASASVGQADLEVARWSFDVRLNEQTNMSIDLNQTIITNNYSMTKVIPGTKGKIALSLNLSGTEVDAKYSLHFDGTRVLPSNLKLYTDSQMQEELSINDTITGVVTKDNFSEPILIDIYWQWLFTDDDETDDWSNKNLSLGLVLDASQAINGG